MSRSTREQVMRRLGAFVCGVCDELSKQAGVVLREDVVVGACDVCLERYSEGVRLKRAKEKREEEHRARMDEMNRKHRERMDKFLEKSIPLLSVTESSNSASYRHGCAQAHDDLAAATNGRFGTRRR